MPGDVMPRGVLFPEAAQTIKPFCQRVSAAWERDEKIALSLVPTDIFTIRILYFSLFSKSQFIASNVHFAVPLPVSSSILRQIMLHEGAMPLNRPFDR